MITVKNNLGGSSKVINGIIGEYKAYANTIEPLSFVDFISEFNGATPSGKIINSGSYTGACISAVALDDTRALLLHSYSSSYKLYGCVVTLTGGEITTGTSVVLSTTSGITQHMAGYIKRGADPNTVYLITNKATATWYAEKITVNGESITMTETGSATAAGFPSNRVLYSASICDMSDDKFLLYGEYYGSSYTYYCVMFMFKLNENGELTFLYLTTNGSNPGSGYHSMAKLDEITAILLNGSASNTLYVLPVTITGDTFSIGGSTLLDNSGSYLAAGHTVATNGANLFATVFIGTDSGTNYGYIAKCKIDNNTVTIEKKEKVTPAQNQYGAYHSELIHLGHNIMWFSIGLQNRYSITTGLYSLDDGLLETKEISAGDQIYEPTGINMPTSVRLGNYLIDFYSRNTSNYYLCGYAIGGRFNELVNIGINKISGLLISKATPTSKGKVYELNK